MKESNNLTDYSVLMSVYFKEKAEFLNASMNSMWNQTVPTDDFVLVCDGELTDDLNRIITKQEKNHPESLNIIRLDNNMGLGEALNVGIKECKHEIIARMDSDDISLQNRCEKQLSKITEDSLDIISGSIIEFQDDINNITGTRRVPALQTGIVVFSKKRNPFNHPAVMFRKSAVEKAGGYSEEYHLFEDYHLWIRMLMQNVRCGNIEEPVLKMRSGDDAIIRRGGRQYAKELLKFHQWMKSSGWISQRSYLLNSIPHVLFCLLPPRIRKIIYKGLRRK